MFIEVFAELERQDRTVAWLARRCDIHPSYALRMLKGDRPLSDDFRRQASEVLGRPAGELFALEQPAEAAS